MDSGKSVVTVGAYKSSSSKPQKKKKNTWGLDQREPQSASVWTCGWQTNPGAKQSQGEGAAGKDSSGDAKKEKKKQERGLEYAALMTF